MPFDVDTAIWDGFMRGVVRGSYYLLLGAGASRGGRDAFGAVPPLGLELANDLIDEFRLPAGPGDLDLPRAYEAAARHRTGLRYPSADSYLRERFSGCTSPPWFASLTRIRWRRIYTLNIDDTLDHAYREQADTRVQTPQVTHWSHPFFDDRSPDHVAIVHLHGRARLLGDEDENNLVFGLAQYFDATAAQHAWHRVFGDTFQSEPFVAVGATLSEELDLAQILRRGNSSSELSASPSLVVLPTIPPLRREELRAYGLIPVETTGAAFFKAVEADIPRFAASMPLPARGRPSTNALRFLSQFRPLTLKHEPERDRYHDLYRGHDATWQDIVRGRDARFAEVGHAGRLAIEAINADITERFFCLHGGPFTGKSTALLRVGREVIAAGVDAHLFIGEERLDLASIAWWLERSGPMVLLIDGLADFGADLSVIADKFDLDTARLAIVGTERDVRLSGLAARLPGHRFRGDRSLAMDALSDDDIAALITTLRESGRLGRITQRNRAGQLVYFRGEHNRELFPAMAGLERAEGFTVRLRDLSSALSRRELRSAYAACALIHGLGYSSPAPLIAAASGLSLRELVRAHRKDEALGELLEYSDGKFKTRQRALATMFVDEIMDRRERFVLSSSLATALAPYVTTRTISERTSNARITSQLMDERNLSRWLGESQVEPWYDAQLSNHGWNARFWEQRALAATRRRDWDPAESYAERAVSTLRDPFTLNTLGTTLLRKAASDTAPGSEARLDYYRRGVDALGESRREGRERFMHPYVTFFEYTLRLARSEHATGSAIPRLFSESWVQWHLWALASPVFEDEGLRAQLEGYVSQYLLVET